MTSRWDDADPGQPHVTVGGSRLDGVGELADEEGQDPVRANGFRGAGAGRPGELIANRAGLGARELVPDPSVRSVRGQQVVVDKPGTAAAG